MNKHVSDYLKKTGITTGEGLIAGAVVGFGTYKAINAANKKEKENIETICRLHEEYPEDEELQEAYDNRFNSNYVYKAAIACYVVVFGIGVLIHVINNKIIYKKLNIETDYAMIKRWLNAVEKLFA